MTASTSLPSQFYLNAEAQPIEISGLILDGYALGKSLRKSLDGLRALTVPAQDKTTPQTFYFVFGTDRLGPLVLINVDYTVSMWLGGSPAYCTVDLQMLEVPDPDTKPKSSSSAGASTGALGNLTDRQKQDGSQAAAQFIQQNTSKFSANTKKLISSNSFKLLTSDSGMVSMLDSKSDVLGVVGTWDGKTFRGTTSFF